MNKEALQKIIITALEDLKGVDIIVKDVYELTDIADIMIFVTGTSTRHVKSLASNVAEEVKKNGVKPLSIEGTDTGDWVLVDMASILVHIMLPEMRSLYDLETLWSGEIRPEQP